MPRQVVQNQGGTIVFKDFTGRAAVYVDGTLAGEKPNAGQGSFRVPMPAGKGERTIAIIIEGPPD